MPVMPILQECLQFSFIKDPSVFVFTYTHLYSLFRKYNVRYHSESQLRFGWKENL